MMKKLLNLLQFKYMLGIVIMSMFFFAPAYSYAHSVAIAYKCDERGVKFWVGTYHGAAQVGRLPSLGGLIIDGTRYDFESFVIDEVFQTLDLDGQVEVYDTRVYVWLETAYIPLAPGTHSFTTTCNSAVECPLWGRVRNISIDIRCPDCVQPPSGMVNWWPGDGDASDIQGSNDGTLMNDATTAPGRVGDAFSFDGVGDYVVLSNSNFFAYNAPMTIDAWIKSSGSSGEQEIISHQRTTYPYTGWGFAVSSGGLEFEWIGTDVDNAITVGTSAGGLDDGQWHHVAVVRTGGTSANNVHLYMDGVQKSTSHGRDSFTSLPWAINAVPLIGARGGEGGGNYSSFFNGLVDEVEIFNRALSAEEILAIYNAGGVGKCKLTTPPVASCNANPATVYLDENGLGSITVADINDGSSDGDDITLSVSPNSFDCGDVGSNSVTLTVSDGDLSDTCTTTVTVTDGTSPEITCPDDIEIDTDEGACGAKVTYTAPVGTDNCPGATTTPASTNLGSGEVFPVGTTTEIFTVTSATGIPVDCNFTVTVIDAENPTIDDCNVTYNIAPSGFPVEYTITAHDNCGVDNVTVSYTSLRDIDEDVVISESGDQITINGSGGVGNIITILATATDVNGNTIEYNSCKVINVQRGDEGVGNGTDDLNTPGHLKNGGNDDEGNEPGNPGAKGGKKNRGGDDGGGR